MTETVTIEMPGELADDLACILEHEVSNATEMYATEEIMAESAKIIRESL